MKALKPLKRTIIGRVEERELLDVAAHSPTSELIAIYGRRRIGKTYLILEHFHGQIVFHLSGVHDAPIQNHLQNFYQSLRTMQPKVAPLPPTTWFEAFTLLAEALRSQPTRKRKMVLFFDEFPWLATHRSGFLQAFDHFWNSHASRRNDVIVVICGSAAAWIIRKVLKARGGLHNRVTRRVRLEPFQLSEIHEYLEYRSIELPDDQIASIAMVFGGVPQYLSLVERGHSASKVIEMQCFRKNGFLRSEYSQLYASLFTNYDVHEQIVRTLAKNWSGMTRTQLLKDSKLKSGGGFSSALEELIESGFVSELPARGNIKKEAVYRLIDEYSHFYWRWIQNLRGRETWATLSKGTRFEAWQGYAFESLCQKHSEQIKAALGISGIATSMQSWRYQPKGNGEEGAQIDLVIDRADKSAHVCEMKFTSGPFTITKAYAERIQRKIAVFRERTQSRFAIFPTLITSHGLVQNPYSIGLVTHQITLADLFKPRNKNG